MKQWGCLLFALITALILFGCRRGEPVSPRPDPIPGNPTGEATASARGWASFPAPHFVEAKGWNPGADVTVTLKVIDGYIIEMLIDGPDETPGIGTWGLEETARIIMKNNSFDIDFLTGATFSSRAVINAGKAALEMIQR